MVLKKFIGHRVRKVSILRVYGYGDIREIQMGGGAEERYDVLSSRGTEAEPASCQIRRTVVLLSRAGYAGCVV